MAWVWDSPESLINFRDRWELCFKLWHQMPLNYMGTVEWRHRKGCIYGNFFIKPLGFNKV